MENKESTVKELIELAKDLNKLMDLDPVLPTAQKTKKVVLTEGIEKVAKFLEPGDKLQKESIATLKAMGIEIAKPPESKAPKAKPSTGKTAIAKAEKEKEKDEFGFTAGSKTSLFAQAIKKKPMTMAEVKELSWNENKAAYNGTWSKLKNMGVGIKTADGKMSIKSKK